MGTLRNMVMLETKVDNYEPEYKKTDLTNNLHKIFRFNTNYKKRKKFQFKI